MKIKVHRFSPQLLSMESIKNLKLRYQDLFDPTFAIHANRELNMSNIKMVGFDMDYTLAVYKKLPMESLQYDLARDYLIRKLNYPHSLSTYSFDPNLLIRGLVVDKLLGNILKLDDQNHVWRGMHCRRQLSKEQLTNLYGIKRIKVGDDRYYSLDTFFSIPEACLLVDSISCFYKLGKQNILEDRFTHTKNKILNFHAIFSDIRKAMDTIHSDESLKKVIAKDIKTYIVQDPEIYVVLKKLHSNGKKLFLLTNSALNYTNLVLDYVFDCQNSKTQPWKDLFDVIIVDANKPAFFTAKNSFAKLSEKLYRGGNIDDFHRMLNVRGAQVLYVGDHIYGDILRSKKNSLWRTCLIIKELGFDIKTAKKHIAKFKLLKQINIEQLQADQQLMRMRTLLGMLQSRLAQKDYLALKKDLVPFFKTIKSQIKYLTNKLQKLNIKHAQTNRALEDKFHKAWGRLFKEDLELSRFGAQVRQYACVYTDNIKNFLHYGTNHTFFTKKERMTHEIDIE
jgi:5'-nucleotidase